MNLDKINERNEKAISTLTPEYQPIARDLVKKSFEAGVPVLVTEGHRSQERQEQLYAQGRTTPGQIVTWTKSSRHTKGIAIDLVPLDLSGKPNYNDTEAYKKLGELSKTLGLEWGGDWKNKDMPHFQFNAAAPAPALPQGGLPPIPAHAMPDPNAPVGAPQAQLAPLGAPQGLPPLPEGDESPALAFEDTSAVRTPVNNSAILSNTTESVSASDYNFNQTEFQLDVNNLVSSYNQMAQMGIARAQQTWAAEMAAKYTVTQLHDDVNLLPIRAEDDRVTYRTNAQIQADNQAAMIEAQRSNAFGQSFADLTLAHFSNAQDRFHTSIAGSAYRTIKERGLSTPYGFVSPLLGAVETLRRAADENNTPISDILAGRGSFERPDADYSIEEKQAQIKRFEESYGPMDQDYRNKIMRATRREDGARAYDAAYRQHEIAQRMGESGILANLGAGIIASMASPQDAPANLFGGFVVKGAGAIAQSARLARVAQRSRLAASVQNAANATVATGRRRVLTEAVSSGLAGAASQNVFDTEYTIADAMGDVLFGAGAGLGLHGAGRLIGVGLFGKDAVLPDDYQLSANAAKSMDEAVERSRSYAVAARNQIVEQAELSGNPDVRAAMADAQDKVLAGEVIAKNPEGLKRASLTTPETSQALRTDLETATALASNARFTRELLKHEKELLKGTQLSEERVVQRAAKQADLENQKHAKRLESAETTFNTSQQHLENRKAALAEANAKLEQARTSPVEYTDGDVSRAVNAERKLEASVSKVETLGQQRDAVRTKINDLNAKVEQLRKTTSDPRKINRAANAVAREQVREANLTSQIDREMAKANAARVEADELASVPREAVTVREVAIRNAEAEVNRLSEQLEKAQQIFDQRKADVDTLRGATPRTADQIAEELRAASPDVSPIQRPLTLDEIEAIQDALDGVTLKDMAKQLGVEGWLRGNNLANAIRMKHLDEGSKKANNVMKQDARVMEKDKTVRTVNKIMNNGVLGKFNTSGTAIVSSKADILQVFGRTVTENSSGAYGGQTASLRKLTMDDSILNPIEGTEQAALSEFAKSNKVGAIMAARSRQVREAFAKQENALYRAVLEGRVSIAQLKSDLADQPDMVRHIQNLYNGLMELNRSDWVSKGNLGDPPPLTDMPIRWNHAALSALAQDRVAMDNFRKAMVDSVKTRRDGRLRENPDLDTLTDQEIDLYVDDYIKMIFSTADGSSFGSLSLKNREFNLWKSSQEMVSTGKVELDAIRKGGWKKLEALYQKGNTVDKDLTIKFEDSTGRKISIEDLTNPSITDSMKKLVRYRSGVIALREVGFDVEDPQFMPVFKEVADRQGATKAELDHVDSVISSMLGRPFNGQIPNKTLELLASGARANMLGGLVWAQAAELPNMLAHVGLVGGIRIIANAGRHHRMARANAKGQDVYDLLSDVEKYTGYQGSEGFRPAAVYDPNENNGFVEGMDLEGERLWDRVLRGVRSAEQLQAIATGFASLNAIMKRGIKEEYVRMVANAVQSVQRGEPIKLAKQLVSAGIDENRIRALAKQEGVFLWKNGEFRGTDLGKINDPVLAADIISGIRRGMGQAVQETFIGETGLWQNSPLMKFFMMFRGYMVGSITKQMVRQYTDFGPGQFVVSAIIGATWAGAVMYAKAWVRSRTMDEDKREEYMKRHGSGATLAQNAIMYHSSLGVGQEALNLVGAFTGRFQVGSRMSPQTMRSSDWLPGLAYIDKLLQGASGAGYAGTDAITGTKPSANDVKRAIGWVPGANSIYMHATLGSLMDAYREDEKEQARRERRAQRDGYAPKLDAEGNVKSTAKY